MTENPDPRPFLAVLADAYIGRRTGIVRAIRGEGSMAVALQEGRIVALETDGFMDASPSEEDRELAAMLAEAFAVGEPAVSRAAARQTLLEALRAPEAQGFFEEGASESADPPLEFGVDEILREAAHSSEMPLVDAALGDLERSLRAGADPRSLQDVTLTPSEAYLMSRLDGVLSARAVLELLPLEAEAARRCLFGLVASGLVVFEDRALAPAKASPRAPQDVRARLKDAAADWAKDERRRAILEAHARLVGEKDHFAVLGLSREATEVEVKTAYFGLAKQFHPDTLGEFSDLGDEIQALFARLGGAFDVLGQAKNRAAYEATLPPAKRASAETATHTPPPPVAPRRAPPSVSGPSLPPAPVKEPSPEDRVWQAEESLKRAAALLGEGKFWEAIQHLEAQVGNLTGRTRHKGRLVLAQAYMHNPKWLHRGEETLRIVIREDPLNVEAYYLLGSIYKSGGLSNRAAAMFRKVLELRPTHRPAADELLALDKAPPPPRRWFKGPSDRSE